MEKALTDLKMDSSDKYFLLLSHLWIICPILSIGILIVCINGIRTGRIFWVGNYRPGWVYRDKMQGLFWVILILYGTAFFYLLHLAFVSFSIRNI